MLAISLVQVSPPLICMMVAKTMIAVWFASFLLYLELFQDGRSDQERDAVPTVKIEDTFFRIYELDLASGSWSIAYYGDEYLASKYSDKHEVEIVYTGGNLAHRVETIESLAWHKIPKLRSIELKSDVPSQLLASTRLIPPDDRLRLAAPTLAKFA